MKTSSGPVYVQEKEVFWAEMAPTDHVVHLYADDLALLDMLEGFVTGGLMRGESVIVLGTDAHMFALNQRLDARGVNLPLARVQDRYIDMNAEAALATFMVDGWPDQQRFTEAMSILMDRALRKGRRVRAFGEMVSILWGQGHSGATVRLEFLWNQFRETTAFPLFCSYPKAGFTQDAEESFKQICAAHTKVISNHS